MNNNINYKNKYLKYKKKYLDYQKKLMIGGSSALHLSTQLDNPTTIKQFKDNILGRLLDLTKKNPKDIESLLTINSRDEIDTYFIDEKIKEVENINDEEKIKIIQDFISKSIDDIYIQENSQVTPDIITGSHTLVRDVVDILFKQPVEKYKFLQSEHVQLIKDEIINVSEVRNNIINILDRLIEYKNELYFILLLKNGISVLNNRNTEIIESIKDGSTQSLELELTTNNEKINMYKKIIDDLSSNIQQIEEKLSITQKNILNILERYKSDIKLDTTNIISTSLSNTSQSLPQKSSILTQMNPLK
jgi:hypothetical protein